jgi:hypothetical protein
MYDQNLFFFIFENGQTQINRAIRIGPFMNIFVVIEKNMLSNRM